MNVSDTAFFRFQLLIINAVSSNLLPAFVALGSNLGDSSQIINAALDHLQSLSYGEFARSNVIVTDPVDCPPGSGKYCNAAARLDLPEEVSVLDWMERLLEIEAESKLRAELLRLLRKLND